MAQVPTIKVRFTKPSEPTDPTDYSYVTMESVIINAHEFDPSLHRTCRVILPLNGSNDHRNHYVRPDDITLALDEGWYSDVIDVNKMTVAALRNFLEDGVAPYEIEQLVYAEAAGKNRRHAYQILGAALVRIWLSSADVFEAEGPADHPVQVRKRHRLRLSRVEEQRRRERGLSMLVDDAASVSEIADKLGVHPATVQRWKANARKP
jgi:hypothetical protein